MWLHDIGMIYEDYRGLSTDQAPQTRGVQAPQLAKPNLSFRNVKIGTQEPTMAASSLAGNVMFGNPTEQEEVINDGPISKSKLCNMINGIWATLDSSSPTDRVALMVLGKLKQEILKP
jgi:hypothetical protein